MLTEVWSITVAVVCDICQFYLPNHRVFIWFMDTVLATFYMANTPKSTSFITAGS